MPPASNTTNSIEKNQKSLFLEIVSACDRAKRPETDVTVIAVSKGQAFRQIREAYDCGIRNFGESYAKEMAEKLIQARSLGINDIYWHFVGAIQSNKISIIKEAHMIHSIGSVRHAKLLNGVAEKCKDIFLQVNLDNNPNRQGVAPDKVLVAISEIKSLKALNLKGFMTVLPMDNKPPSFWFSKMAALKNEILRHGLMDKVMLSMGMSGDFKEAIAYGADFLRIGSRIFGPRE